MLNIRQYREEDRDYLRRICVETALSSVTERTARWLPVAYCDYYMDNCPEYIFVLTDSDVPVGYILCSSDEHVYRRKMKKVYLPIIKGISYWAYLSLSIMLNVKDKFPMYPAHLHIDILADYRRKGMGVELMNALFAKLSESNIEAVKLTCSPKNKSAITFYKKYGFTVLKKGIFGVIMGKKAEV